MNKKFIFLSSIIAASVIIGVTINIINANNNKNSDISTNNDATEIATTNNNYEYRFAALEKRVTDLEDKTKTQEEEINELKAEIGTLNNNSSKNTTVNYYSTNNNYTNKIYQTEKETIVKENTDNAVNTINDNSTLSNDETKNNNNNVGEEIKKLNDKIDELKKELTPDEYWMIGKWESLSETQVYQFEINKDGTWQTRDGKEKGIYDDNKLIIINDYTLNSKHSIYYTFLKQSNESAKLTLNIDNGYTSYRYNNNVSSFKSIVNKVNGFSNVETEVQKIELKIDNPVITNDYETKLLSTIIYPKYLSDNITYSSSNENVATIINSDELKPVSNGKTTITAKSSNGKTSSVEVTVNIPNAQKDEYPSSVEIQNCEDMTIGEEKQLTINFYPENIINKNGKWYSSNENVISITDNGYIKANNLGSATITFESENKNAINLKEINVYPTEDRNFVTIKNKDIYNDDNIYINFVEQYFGPKEVELELNTINRTANKYCLKLSSTSSKSTEGNIIINDNIPLECKELIYLDKNQSHYEYINFDANNLIKNSVKKVKNYKFYIQVYKVNGDNDNNLEYLYTTNQITISNE